MEESKLLELLKQHDEDLRFEVEMKKPIPASREPEADGSPPRKYVTFVYDVKVGGEEMFRIEERYSRARRYHWRLVQLGLDQCLPGGELTIPPMYWWRNMRDDPQNIRIRARQMQTYYTRLLSNPEEMIPILVAATADRVGADGKVRARPPPRSLKSAQRVAAAAAEADRVDVGDEEKGEVKSYQTAEDANATDSDDDADEDGQQLAGGISISMPDDADADFFGNDDGDDGASGWDEGWEETFFDGSFSGAGGGNYSTSRHISDTVNVMSVLDGASRFVSYNDEREAEGSAFTDFMDPDAGMSTSFGGGGGGGGMAGGGTMDTSTASLPKPVE